MDEAKKNDIDDPVAERNLHSEQLLHGLNELRQLQLLCDVILRVGSTRISAHRAVLASCSPYFKAMFISDLSERGKEEIEFQSIEPSALEVLIEFAYTGQVQITQVNVQYLLPAANLLQLKTVTQKCCDFLASQLHPSNCIGISEFAEIHACHNLYEKSMDYLFEHFVEVTEAEEFAQLSNAKLQEILSSDELTVPTEEMVFHALNTWIQYDPEQRCDCLSQLLKCVRLPQLPVSFLTQLLDSYQLNNDAACQKLVQEAMQYKLQPDLRLKHERNFQAIGDLITKTRRPPKVLCAVGGKNGLFATLDSVEVYHPESREWSELTPLPSRRFECGAVVLNQKLYVLGGMVCSVHGTMSYRYHDNKMECLNAETNSWSKMKGMGQRRSALAVAVVRGFIYAVGGYDGESYLRTVERYDASTNSWDNVAPMQSSRSCFTAAVLDDALYAVGGYGPPCLSSMERYDPVTDAWEMLAPMSEKRINFGMGAICGFLYVVGGHNGAAYLSSMERYDPQANQWTRVASMGKPRTGLGVSVIGNHLYAVGGHSGAAYLSTVQCYNPYKDEWSDVHHMSTCRCSFGLAAL